MGIGCSRGVGGAQQVEKLLADMTPDPFIAVGITEFRGLIEKLILE